MEAMDIAAGILSDFREVKDKFQGIYNDFRNEVNEWEQGKGAALAVHRGQGNHRRVGAGQELRRLLRLPDGVLAAGGFRSDNAKDSPPEGTCR